MNLMTVLIRRYPVFSNISISSRLLLSTSSNSDSLQERINEQLAGSKDFILNRTKKFEPDVKNTQADWIAWLSKRVNYDTIIEDYLADRELTNLRQMQEFSADRKNLLGGELSAARFVVAMNGRVKLHGNDFWYSKQTHKEKPLPQQKTHGLHVEAIDLSKTDLIYEGVDNLFQAESLLHLSLANCTRLDEWAISKLVMLSSLVSLDLSGNQFVTERSLIPLHHLKNLRKLDLGGIEYFKNQPLALIMLEELLPHCVVVNVQLSQDQASNS